MTTPNTALSGTATAATLMVSQKARMAAGVVTLSTPTDARLEGLVGDHHDGGHQDRAEVRERHGPHRQPGTRYHRDPPPLDQAQAARSSSDTASSTTDTPRRR